MWSNAPLVLLSVRLGERFRLRLPLGLWAVSGLLLSLDGLLAWVPGTWGGRLRPLSDGAYAFLRELQAQPPQELVNVRLRDKEGPVQVSARTWGPLPAKKEGARPRRGMPWALCLPWELAACWLSLLLVGLLLEQSLGGLLGGGALLFLWRLLPRPVLLALLLPVNLPLAGLFTPVVDGLLVAWACAWTGVSLGLWVAWPPPWRWGLPACPWPGGSGPGGCPPPCYRGERRFTKHTRRESTPPSGDWGRRFLWVLPRDAPHFFTAAREFFTTLLCQKVV